MKQFWVDVLGRGAYYKQPVFFASEKIDKMYIFALNQTFKIVRSSKKSSQNET